MRKLENKDWASPRDEAKPGSAPVMATGSLCFSFLLPVEAFCPCHWLLIPQQPPEALSLTLCN